MLAAYLHTNKLKNFYLYEPLYLSPSSKSWDPANSKRKLSVNRTERPGQEHCEGGDGSHTQPHLEPGAVFPHHYTQLLQMPATYHQRNFNYKPHTPNEGLICLMKYLDHFNKLFCNVIRTQKDNNLRITLKSHSFLPTCMLANKHTIYKICGVHLHMIGRGKPSILSPTHHTGQLTWGENFFLSNLKHDSVSSTFI